MVSGSMSWTPWRSSSTMTTTTMALGLVTPQRPPCARPPRCATPRRGSWTSWPSRWWRSGTAANWCRWSPCANPFCLRLRYTGLPRLMPRTRRRGCRKGSSGGPCAASCAVSGGAAPDAAGTARQRLRHGARGHRARASRTPHNSDCCKFASGAFRAVGRSVPGSAPLHGERRFSVRSSIMVETLSCEDAPEDVKDTDMLEEHAVSSSRVRTSAAAEQALN
mmetsp:Transcript_147893/g.474810  ORF Transcript_147893/g.474810 Transcript_147893/m.474810 type:complete len:221 (-) Transcript_147893:9-671(-)